MFDAKVFESRFFGSKLFERWWRRPSGGREVIQLALPLIVTSLSWTILTFVDRIFLKWYSGAAMTAAFSASAVWFALACLPLGVCGYVSTFVAQYHGSGQREPIGGAVWQGVWLALLATPLALVAIPLAPTLFAWAGHADDVRFYETRYFQILCTGLPAMWVCQAISSFYSGRGKTFVLMWIDGGFAIVNGILDYLWIFGVAGFTAMGVDGAAWATSVSLWLKACVFVSFLLAKSNRENYSTRARMRWDGALLRRLLRFGAPSGFQMLLDVMGFTVFVVLVGRIGALEAEATSMAFSVSSLAFMPVWGISMAASILVGQRLGENRPDLAERSVWTTLSVALVYMALISLFYLLAPGAVLSWFATGEPDRSALELDAMARGLLMFVAAYNLFDAVLMVMVSAIKGAGDTRFVLHTSLVMAAALSGLTWLSVEYLRWGVFATWGLITAWVWTGGTIYWLRFRHGAWRSMRVIDANDGGPTKTASPCEAALDEYGITSENGKLPHCWSEVRTSRQR